MTASAQAFSRTVRLDEIPPGGFDVRIEADAAARAAIAARLAIPEVKRLTGEFVLQRTADGFALRGRIDAALSRICVASLEPMDEMIAEDFDIRLAQTPLADRQDGEVDLDADAPEPLDGDALDLGEILVQQLALAMEPYPRKEGAKSLAEEHGAAGGSTSPFAALQGAFAARRDKE
jgi:hypothetical protein